MSSCPLSLLRCTGSLVLVAVVALASGACGSNTVPSAASGTATGTSAAVAPSAAPSAQSTSAALSPTPAATASPAAEPPFTFPADAVIAFYEGEGLACAPPIPSTKAAGWTVRTCQGTDAAGRPVAVGVVTDPEGRLGDGFASVTALPGEDLLEPTDALDMLSGFLGAMLGDKPATELLPWLAGHLGDQYAEMEFGGGTVATYTESADDPTRIYVEVAGPSYLVAPAP
jgi:hypothetical protein